MVFDKFKKFVSDAKQEIDDKLTDAIGDGDYTQTTDETAIEKPKNDGKQDKQ